MTGDMKEALASGRKPDITHVRKPLMVYTARGCEYGDQTQGGKYERSNYLRPAGVAGVSTTRDDFIRLRGYLRAAVGHLVDVLDAMERHQALDPYLLDVAGMKAAAFAIDMDAKPGCPVGPSKLPHLCGGAASLNMAITQAVTYGLLPADPGQPWRGTPAQGELPLGVRAFTATRDIERGEFVTDKDVRPRFEVIEWDGEGNPWGAWGSKDGEHTLRDWAAGMNAGNPVRLAWSWGRATWNIPGEWYIRDNENLDGSKPPAFEGWSC